MRGSKLAGVSVKKGMMIDYKLFISFWNDFILVWIDSITKHASKINLVGFWE